MTTPLLQEFPELAHYSRQDLEDMLIDPTYFQAVFHSLETVKVMYQSQTELSMANEAIARRNLILQDSLYQLRSETKDAFDEAKRLEARWKGLEKEQREVYQRFSPQFLHMRLRHSLTSQDDKSEAVASEFVHEQASTTASATWSANNNGPEIDKFIKDYKELRKIYHKRAIWNEKWNIGQVEWRDD
ncbi:Modifier of rudimentary (Mod(r)) domain containing protein [Amanita muscaria]